MNAALNNTPATPAVTMPKPPYIFLAEDDVDDQEFFAEAIAHRNSAVLVHAVGNGKQALHFLESLEPDQLPALIVLDYNLPEADGADILRSLLHNPKFAQTPKVVWSTSSAARYEDTCLQLGAIAYYVKPGNLKGINELAGHMLHFCGL